ncbi:MAG: hypothetical protein R8G01_01965 [Ilumatobacteraceae bacterium]|nr:hypothetical protein [Ilumatobacteraceae bacterium]
MTAMRRGCSLLFAACSTLVLVGCAGGYEDENRAILDELPNLDGVDVISEEHGSYCSGDTCLFGDDRSSARIVASVDTDLYTPDSLIEAYHDQLSGWSEATIDRGCLDDSSPCDDILAAMFTRDRERISLGLDNWSVAQIEIGVDARGIDE